MLWNPKEMYVSETLVTNNGHRLSTSRKLVLILTVLFTGLFFSHNRAKVSSHSRKPLLCDFSSWPAGNLPIAECFKCFVGMIGAFNFVENFSISVSFRHDDISIVSGHNFGFSHCCVASF